MADLMNRARNCRNFRIQKLAINEDNNRLCRDCLEQLRFNQVVRKLELDRSPYFGSIESSKVLGEVLGSSTTLQELSLDGVGMSSDGLRNIIRGVLGNPNSGLVKLDISSNTQLGSTGAKLVEELLLGNVPSLTRLGIAGAGFAAEDMALVAKALAENTTLEDLSCGGGYGTIQRDGDGPLSSILKALTPVERTFDQGGKDTATLPMLRMTYEYERGLAENLARMLSRNYSLQGLSLWNFQLNREEWTEVWKALRHNKRLHSLDLSGCGKGLSDAFVDLMDLLEVNGRIRLIVLPGAQLEAGQPAQLKQQLDRNKQLAEVQLEELNDIMKKLESKKWNWKDLSECQEVAKLGRKLGKWATSSSTAAVVPITNIRMAMIRFQEVLQMLGACVQPQLGKSMMQDMQKLTDQNTPTLEGACVGILLEYGQVCNATGDLQNAVESYKKGISLTAAWSEKNLAKVRFHVCLVYAYLNLSDAPQAERAMRDAQRSMPDSSGISENYILGKMMAPDMEVPRDIDLRTMAMFEALQGRVALFQCQSCALGKVGKHVDTALENLQKSLVRLTTICATESASFADKVDWIEVALTFSEAMSYCTNFQSEAKDVCEKALLAATDLGFSRLIAKALLQCGCLATLTGNYEVAERYIRRGLAQSDRNGYHDPFSSAVLYCELGSILQSRGGSYLSQAEDAFRQAIKSWSEGLNRSTLTSDFRIMASEKGKGNFNCLQSCLYEIYEKAEENVKARKAREALVVAERGRCLDLMLNLQDPGMSRTRDKEELLCDDHIGVMDWEKFSTDGEYAWRHLEKCMAICTDMIKDQNPEVKRVTFVEYTLTNYQILIWVLHSYGTEKPSRVHTTSTLPSMYSVDVKEAFEEMVGGGDSHLKEYFSQLYGPQKFAAKYESALVGPQRMEAVELFEYYIGKLLSDHAPKKYLVQLYELLIKPIDIADNLVAGEPLIFIPHEALSFVPFVALLSKDRKHLIEEHPVGAASSLRSLGWATKQYTFLNARPVPVSDKNQMLLVADPFPLGQSHVPLEDSIEEVRNIETMLRDQYSSKVLVGEDASLKTVVSHMKTASWYHIACHGEVTAQYPQGVLFLGARADISRGAINQGATSSPDVSDQRRRGFLTPEIIAKDLGSTSTARAAVLSACKVGLGKKTGEGLLGLSRAFLQAGVPLVLAPLRPVDSRKCSAFMQHLYKKLVGGESVMFALRSTMVDVIHKRVQVVAARHEDEECDDEDDDEEEEIKWQVWDWAAWLAVGFPGVCLTSLTATPNVGNTTHNVQARTPNDGNPTLCEATPNVGNPRFGEAILVAANEDRPLTGTVDSSKDFMKPLSPHEIASSSDSALFQNGTRDYSSLGAFPRISSRKLQVSSEGDGLDDDGGDGGDDVDDGVLAAPSSVSGADIETPKSGASLSEPAAPSREDLLEKARAEIIALTGTKAQLEHDVEASTRNCEQLNYWHTGTLEALDRLGKEKAALEEEIVALQEQIWKTQANDGDKNVMGFTEMVGLEQEFAHFEHTQAKHAKTKTKLSEEIASYKARAAVESRIYKTALLERNARIEELVGQLAQVKLAREASAASC